MTFKLTRFDIDAVVMLTASDWFKELRSNRYHYATRFARGYPVIFVQPDLTDTTYYFEPTENENILVLHIYSSYNEEQSKLLQAALSEKNILSPLLWIYNPQFINFIEQAYSPFIVHHATEDYFSPDSPLCNEWSKPGTFFYSTLIRSLCYADLIMCVSEGVKESINHTVPDLQTLFVNTNGCDFEFYEYTVPLDGTLQKSENKKIIFYQGNIYHKLDFDLLIELAERMPAWEFHFCGPVTFEDKRWDQLTQLKNVTHLGTLTPELLRSHAHQATVGIIPFTQHDYLKKRSFPLKAFEYLACGLPVVSTSIDALSSYSDVFLFADNVLDFQSALETAATNRYEKQALVKRLEQAKKMSYNHKFSLLVERLNAPDTAFARLKRRKKLNILILYEAKSVHVNAIKEHLESFAYYSYHKIHYAPGSADFSDRVNVDLTSFDVVIIHYSLRLCVESGNYTLSPQMATALRAYSGYKVLFIQDEYDATNTAKSWIKSLGINLVYTCVPTEFIETIYPKNEFENVEFISNLTGYVPERLKQYKFEPLDKRTSLIGYRGRDLPFWYGDLGQEKMNIGVTMRAIAEKRQLPVDIEWCEEKRIYGDKWYDFLASSRATLGTESGSNVFDFTGEIRKNIEHYLETSSGKASYQEVRKRFLSGHENLIKMNQISPKIFESIALGTALILFEGTYSGVVQADKHYIPLKKDFSNIDEVLDKLNNLEYLKNMVARAYTDIILRDNYSYRAFINRVDQHLEQRASLQTIFQLNSYDPVRKSAEPPVSGIFEQPSPAACIEKIDLYKASTPFAVPRQIQYRALLLRCNQLIHKHFPSSVPTLRRIKHTILRTKVTSSDG